MDQFAVLVSFIFLKKAEDNSVEPVTRITQ